MREQKRIDFHLQNMGNDLRPTMSEVVPTVGNSETAGGLLGLSLAHDIQFAAIVQFPDDTMMGKRSVGAEQ